MQRGGGTDDHRHVRRDNADLGEGIDDYVHPSREKHTASGGQIKTGDCAEFDGETLEKDGNKVAHEDDEQEIKVVGCSG